jgi:hypothetical protein
LEQIVKKYQEGKTVSFIIEAFSRYANHLKSLLTELKQKRNVKIFMWLENFEQIKIQKLIISFIFSLIMKFTLSWIICKFSSI